MRPERKGGFVNLYIVINPFYATGLNGLRFNITHFSLMFHFYTLKTSENQRFYDFFRDCAKMG